jgi:hypothetical protein
MRYSTLALLPALVAASPMVQVGTIHNDAAPVLSSVHSEEVPNSCTFPVTVLLCLSLADSHIRHGRVQKARQATTRKEAPRLGAKRPLQEQRRPHGAAKALPVPAHLGGL